MKPPLKINKAIVIIVSLFVLLFLLGACLLIKSKTGNEEKLTILIEKEITLNAWLHSKESAQIVDDPFIFEKLAQIKNLVTIKAGYYQIQPHMTNNQLVNKFKAGLVDPISIAIENMKNIYEVCGRLGKKLQADSSAFAEYIMSPSNLNHLNSDAYNVMGFIPPNTYNFNYTTTPQEFMERMLKNYHVFWTEERLNRVQAMNMTPAQVITLASIVKAETAKNDEAPKIAQLYLNRLRINMALQSDPTATYGKQLEHVERVSNVHTSVKSAYNTYQFVGLPPGPINFPETIYLEAVLHPELHDYLYMCAQPKKTGYHNFAATYAEHQRYAAVYHQWLDANGIR
jgi:UPF0755 protein